jgi:uncharacterized protein YndB with AHSA1/START domain
MASVERTVTVSTPVEKVWAYLSDFTTTEDWDPPTVRTVRTSGNGDVGTTYQNYSKVLGKEREVSYVVTEFEVERRFQLAGKASGLELLDTITFEPSGGGTSVTYHSEFTPLGAARLVTPLLPAGLKVLADRVEASLQEKLSAL